MAAAVAVQPTQCRQHDLLADVFGVRRLEARREAQREDETAVTIDELAPGGIVS